MSRRTFLILNQDYVNGRKPYVDSCQGKIHGLLH
jgi:hypothetical protein